MESVCRWTKAITDGPDDNPSHLGQFSNIFINYTCLQCNTQTNCPSYLLHTSWKVFPGGLRLPPSVWVSTLVTLAGSQIFSLITQVCLVYKVILNQITCFESHGEFLKSWVVFQGGLRSF